MRIIYSRNTGYALAARLENMSDETKLMKAEDGKSTFDIQKFAFGQRIGLQTDSSETSVIQAAIDALTLVDSTTLESVLTNLFGTGSTGDDKPKFGYDPSVTWLAGVEMTINVLSLDVLLVDGQFYGLLIKVAGDGPFKGLVLEIIYRKINDHLGEFSADLTLPDKFRKLKLGAASVTLPIVSLSIWTNGDFSINIGWPLGDRSFNIEFPPDPIPWAGGGGFYFARLRSEDEPGKLGVGYNPIIEFGIGLKIGAATEGDYGVLSYGASIYLFGTFQGFLAWKDGNSFSDGLDYYWFCASVGITGHLEGSVDFVVISVSVSLDITASVTMALEKDHATYALAEFTATVEASIKILFVRIHFSFSLDVKVSVTFGSGPAASISGPNPTPALEAMEALVAQTENLALEGEIAAEIAAPIVRPRRQISNTATTVAAIPVALSYMLQPSIRFDVPSATWVPVAVASLIIDRTAPATGDNTKLGAGSDSFSLMVQSLASYLLLTYGNYTDPTATVTPANLQALQIALGGDPSECGGQPQAPGTTQFNLQSIYNWLTTSNISFTITGTDPTSTGPADGALFPIIPGLTLTYNGAGITFGDAAAPANYLTALDNYFKELSLVGDGSIDTEAMRALLETDSVSTAGWMPGVIFSDYFNILAKQLCKELCDLKTPGTLEADLALIDIGNMAGIVTRFLQHGLRLPDPSDLSSPIQSMNLLPLFDLTGQQFDLAPAGAPVLTAVLSGKSSVNVTIAGTGSAQLKFALEQAPTASPLRNPQQLPRINNAQISFLLRQGIPWAQVGTNWQMFGFPDTLQSQLRLASSLSLELNSTDGSQDSQGHTILTPATGLGSLMIRFSLTQIPDPSGTGNLKTIFQVTGTDEGTRDLMELLFASGDLSKVTVQMLLPAGGANSGAGYTTSAADATSVLFKTNLSTYNQPNAAMMMSAMRAALEDTDAPPPLGATSAAISDTSNFLLLLWECSVVNSGGFYLYVPDADFGSAPQLNVAVLVSNFTSPATQVPVNNYQNMILVNSTLSANDRVQGLVFQSDATTPVTEPKPNYPAGTVSFGATWTGAPTDVEADNTSAYSTVLYQMLEFQVAPGTGITTGSGWSMPLGPNTPPGTPTTTWEYQRAVPVYRFVDNAANPPNRYGAIGLETNLSLQLVDIFGNAYGLKPLQAMPVYNDLLIPVDQWPGTYILYTFNTGTGGEAGLQLVVTFDPAQVTEKATALAYYQIIYDQLSDPRTSLAITTALAAGPVTLATTGGTSLQAALTAFAAQVVAYLAPNSTSQPPTCVFLSGNVAVDYVTRIDEDLFPLWVSLTTTRNAPAESETFNYPDGFLSVVSQLPPLLSPNADPTQCPDPTVTPDSTALRNWSIGFEKAFNNFDGANGMLKVLSGNPPAKVTATKSRLSKSAAGDITSTPGSLWAMKWGATNGVSVTFGNSTGEKEQAPVYFAPLPLSTKLISTNVQINSYDGSTGVPGATTQQTYSGVDMDGMARSFLQSVDALLSPNLANAMAQLDSVQYGKLMLAKEELAFAISSSISWVLADQMPSGGSAGMGDVKSAQVRFRENLLASLATDFSTSVIVQVPASVTVKNTFDTEDASTRPPDFFGSPTPSNATNQYTISNTALPVEAGTGYLNFLVGAPDPSLNADLKLAFNFDIGFLDHQFQTSEEQFGYIPSSWLRFIVPDVDPTGVTPPVLDVSMGELDIPLPLRAYPSPPRLVSQSATSTYPDGTHPAPTTIGQALLFDYNLTITRPLVAQDDLHMTVEFNRVDPTESSLTGSGGPLFTALANFQAFQAQYLPAATTAILATQGGGNKTVADQWLQDIVALVTSVADAWQGSQGDGKMAEAAEDVALPAPYTWDFVLQVPHEDTAPNVLILTWVPNETYTGNPVWPLINGVTGTTGQGLGNNQLQYTLQAHDPNLDQPTLTWQGLSVITNQSVSTEAWIERNENLAGGEATNPAFVYTTSIVSFPSPVIPLLDVPTKLTLANTKSVNDAVNQMVTQMMQPTSPFSQIGLSLEADYSFVLVSGGPGQLQTTLPVFLVKTGVSTDTGTLPQGVESPQKLISDLEGALISWYKDFLPATANASLLFEVTIFAANSQQPIARLLDVEAPISGSGWWTPS